MNFVFQIAMFLSVIASPSDDEVPLWRMHTEPLERRVDDLIARMTLEEKVEQMRHEAPSIDRLGIPSYNWWNECLHGVARAGLATVFPQAIGLAASWDRELLFEVALATSREGRAKHHEAVSRNQRDIYQGLTFWSPNINIFRDPRWGRGHETYGEDPYLTGALGLEFVKGIQGDDPFYFRAIATPKHFAVHSGPEPQRHSFNSVVDVYDLWDTYLPAFRKCVVDGKAYSVMGAVTVKNTGSRFGQEVSQLYLSPTKSNTRSPIRALRSFQRTHLSPGESKRIVFRLSPDELSFISERGVRQVTPGFYGICVGGRQPSLHDMIPENGIPRDSEMLAGFLEIEGSALILPQ